MSVKSGKSSSGSPMYSGLHSAAESAPVLVRPSGATAAAVIADAAVPMLNRVFGVTGVRVSASLQPNPSAQTIVPTFAKASAGKPSFAGATAGKPAPTATDTHG